MLDLRQFFALDADPALFLYGSYSPGLVALSVVVAVLAAISALHAAGLARHATSRKQRATLIVTGAVALGGGIWSMHFIGMLAFELCTPVSYSRPITLLSMLPGLGASLVALSLLSRRHLSGPQLIEGGVLIGAGIGTMHYSGMAAMVMAPALRYDPLWFAGSIVVAVTLAVLALWLRFRLRRLQRRLSAWVSIVTGGTVLGLAVAGMHYTGMAAARFVGTAADTANADTDFVAGAVALTTIGLTVLVAVVNGMLRYQQLYHQIESKEARLKAIFDTAVDGMITIDGNGLIHDFNQAAEALFGWTSAEVVDRNISMLMPEPHRSHHDRYLAHYLTTGDARIIGVGREVMAQRRDGSLVPIRLAIGQAAVPGEPLFVAFVTDISQRKAMEQALRDSEEQHRTLLRNIPGLSFRRLLDEGRAMLFMSDAVLGLTGWDAAEFVERGRRFCELVHPDDRPTLRAAIDAATHGGGDYAIEYRLNHRDGRVLWMWESGSVIFDAAGEPAWVDGVVFDLSERHRMEQELRESRDRAELAAASKTAFLANMSHEIRTPMNAIIGFTELLLDTRLDAFQQRHLETVRRSARSLLGLLNDILDTAKLERGAVDIETVDFSLRELVHQVAASLRLTAESKGLALDVSYPPTLGDYFKGDPLRILQVLTNLVGNAIKFTERGGVRIEVGGTPGALRIDVVDTGIGIAPDRIARIFEPFAQADASTSRRFGGTGLGTTIARQLAELMHGRLEVDSEVGVGSRFMLHLPLPAGDAVAAEQEAPIVRLPSMTMLVADDVPQNLELMTLVLGRAGHRLVTAANGDEAFAAFLAGRFDVVLMDVQMPHTDGLEATRRIRAHERLHALAATPIVALTASVLNQDRVAAREAGMDGFASKPLDMSRLMMEIARVTGQALTDTRRHLPASVETDGSTVADWQRGIALWGDADALCRAVRRFLDSFAGSAELLAGLATAGEHEALCQHVHRLRGAAANLCLPAVSTLAMRIESEAAAGRVDALPTLCNALKDALDAVAAELAQHGHRPDAAAATTPAAGGEDIPALARALHDTLTHGEFDDAVLGRLLDSLKAAGRGTVASRIEKAIDEFEFPAAQSALAALYDPTATESPSP
ncbi:PAS domain S-box protein [Denitromonas iodatirespirans]|uniref:Sensor protein FixL n=1 Tax=Denitromonas iodatirespirans TaxID=2795389 RepID=A0A944DEG0_DENI1|nr:PAS domain S-box protein [Denitromonas iodatirespirans]MBT0961308.1 PAS domain S-box protein [Denitromonas iodatirespirans]